MADEAPKALLTSQEWDDGLARYQGYVRMLIAFVVSLFGSVAVAVPLVVSSITQIKSAVAPLQVEMPKVIANNIANNSRLDEADAPPPTQDAKNEIAAIKAAAPEPIVVPETVTQPDGEHP